jgi:hypothetical protein
MVLLATNRLIFRCTNVSHMYNNKNAYLVKEDRCRPGFTWHRCSNDSHFSPPEWLWWWRPEMSKASLTFYYLFIYFIHITFSFFNFFIIHLFTYAYIVWVISPCCPLPHPLPLLPAPFSLTFYMLSAQLQSKLYKRGHLLSVCTPHTFNSENVCTMLRYISDAQLYTFLVKDI